MVLKKVLSIDSTVAVVVVDVAFPFILAYPCVTISDAGASLDIQPFDGFAIFVFQVDELYQLIYVDPS